MKKENKVKMVGVRLTETQAGLLDKLISTGKAKTPSSAIQYLINQYQILNK